MTDLELWYLYAMAEKGSQPQRAAEVPARLGRTAQQMGPVRSRLIDEGLLYTPEHGYAAFTVPRFDRYMLRRHGDLAGAEPKRDARRPRRTGTSRTDG